MGSPELRRSSLYDQANACFDSAVSGHRVTDTTFGKVCFISPSNFTDRRAAIYQSNSLPPTNHTVDVRVANTEAVQIPCTSFLLYINIRYFIPF